MKIPVRGKKKLALLLAGFSLFISDLVTDILVALQYWFEGEYWWFGLTLLFVIVPYLIVSRIALYQVGGALCKNRSCCSCFVHVAPRVCSPIIVRYGKEFYHWKKTYLVNSPCVVDRVYKGCTCRECENYREGIIKSNESQYLLATVHYVETLTESAPQWCLQIYIMFRQWDFPGLTVFSTVISLISLTWSITALEKTRRNKEGHNFTLPTTVVYFTLQLFSLLSRVFAIVGIAYVSKEYVSIVLALHWLIVTVILMWADKIKCGELTENLIIFIKSFLFLLHVPDVLTKTRTSHFVLYTLLSVENVLLATLAVTIPMPDVKHMSVLRPLLLSLVTISVVLGNIFYIVYNKFSIPPEEGHKSDEEERTDQTNKSVKTDEPHK